MSQYRELFLISCHCWEYLDSAQLFEQYTDMCHYREFRYFLLLSKILEVHAIIGLCLAIIKPFDDLFYFCVILL